jgi:hypothetical protein
MRALISVLLAVALALAAVPLARAAVPAGESDAGAIGRTPPRLSYTSGEVSFWRPGAQDWAPAQLNTPLAPGDELDTGSQGSLEVQVGSRAFVRAWGDTQLGLTNQEPDFVRLKVTSGHVSLDLRAVDPGRTVEVDTPHGAFTIERPGYYRLDVTPGSTSFITRRGGQASLTPAGGETVAIAPSEGVVLQGAPNSTVQRSAAPELDAWDRWNYERSDQLLDAMSAPYVPAGVYGACDLEHYGDWRVVPTYGVVWTPRSVAAGWVPYSTGRWILDPYYGWTWVDAAPWGWAPYHYGRWVLVNGHWAWAPGPAVARPVYAPALVAFFGAPGVRVAAGAPGVSWVALSWGEPLVPWWGRAGFIGRPTWAGWSGPRIVNNVVVNRTTVVHVDHISVYKNTSVRNAVVAVRADHFGRRPVQDTRFTRVDVRRLQPAPGALSVKPHASGYVAGRGPAALPPATIGTRPVAATPPPARAAALPRAESPEQTRRAGPVEPQRPPLPRQVEPRQHSQAPVVQRGVERHGAIAPPAPEAARGAQPMAPVGPLQRLESEPQPERPLAHEPASRLAPGRLRQPPGQQDRRGPGGR